MTSLMEIYLTSRQVDILLTVVRGPKRRLGLQIEEQIRRAVREGRLRPHSCLPSTRDLARQLTISRPVVTEAYAQLAAEGYLIQRQGARPMVANCMSRRRSAIPKNDREVADIHFDFRPSMPDLSIFPRDSWLRRMREALRDMSHEDLGYDEPHGCAILREVLAEYLGRVRGVIADPAQILITSGYAQGRRLICQALNASGVKRIAVEDPGYSDRHAITHANLRLVPVAVDEEGIRTDMLKRITAGAIIVTPAHQHPTGVVMSGPRRRALVDWLQRGPRYAIEDDYDAEYRYDHAPIGALQGLAPDHVVYAGTVSKTLAPALRLGWLVVPRSLLAHVRREQKSADLGCPRIEQHALAHFISRGHFDRHMRRARGLYRLRRDALLSALASQLPDARVAGIAAGLHACVMMPHDDDELAIQEEAYKRGIAIETMGSHWLGRRTGAPTLLLGFAGSSESVLKSGVRALVKAIDAARARTK